MHGMVKQVETQTQNIFIIDEVFKGTNTVERLALAKSILDFLNTKKNIIIASSHDLELIELLKDSYQMFHFTETINNNELFFDHTIKKGSLKTRNAIKIIEMEGFPATIVKDAYLTSKVIASSEEPKLKRT